MLLNDCVVMSLTKSHDMLGVKGSRVHNDLVQNFWDGLKQNANSWGGGYTFAGPSSLRRCS